MTIWFISDLHFHHNNILKFCASSRPFSSVEEMNEKLVEQWNSQVQKGDTVWFLGDFSFARNEADVTSIFNRLEGQKFLIKGNHDHKEVRAQKWSGIFDYYELRMPDCNLVLFHYPMVEHNGFPRKRNIHLYGHVHSTKEQPFQTTNYLSLDVGYDNLQRLISYEEVYDMFKDKLPEKYVKS